jgi:RNA polymerase sigma-70 factor (ECF subfamily)
MALDGINDAELARKCRQDSAEAWRELVRRVSPMVYRLSLRMLRSTDEAQDACQEVFLRIHRSFDTYDATRPLAPWVGRITYNVCLRRLTKVSRKKSLTTDPEEIARVSDTGNPGPEVQAAGKEAQEILEEALMRLSAQDQALVDLRYREGLSDAEVAEATGMPVGTVKTRLHRARGKLRKMLSSVFKGGAA